MEFKHHLKNRIFFQTERENYKSMTLESQRNSLTGELDESTSLIL